MRFALVKNTLVPEMNAMETCVQTSATYTQLATSDFQTTYMYLKMIATHRYSPPSMLLPQGIYAIEFSAGLNSLQVH